MNLELRDFTFYDIDNLIKYTCDEDISLNNGFPSLDNKHLAKNFILYHPKHSYAISLNNELIGYIELEFMDRVPFLKENEAMISLWIGKEHQGKGYGTKATELIIDKAFNELNINRLYYGFFSGNNRSKRVQEKLGFKFYNKHRYYFSYLGEEIEVEDYILDKKYD